MKIGLVLVPTPGWWCERLVGTSTNAGWKVLRKGVYFYSFAHLLCIIKWVPSHCMNMHPQFVVGLHKWRVQQSRQPATVILWLGT